MHAVANAAEDKTQNEANWNSRFSWFTKGTCSDIATIRGDHEARTVSFVIQCR